MKTDQHDAALHDARKALACLYIAVSEDIADDVNKRVEAAFAALSAHDDEIELRLDADALAVLTAIVRQHRMKMQPDAPANILIDVIQEGLDRLMLQTIKGTRSALRGPRL